MEESAPMEPSPEPEAADADGAAGISSAPPQPPKADVIYGAVVGTLYVLAVGVQVFLVVDEVTHGALSAQVGAWWRTMTAQLRERRRVAAEFRAHLPWVLWEAQELADEAHDNREGGTP